MGPSRAVTRAALVVTTSLHPNSELVNRARAVAEQCGAPFWPRRGGISGWWDRPDVELVYVVSAEREELRGPKDRLSVHEGLMKLKAADGLGHPLLRAVQPPGALPVGLVLDGTLGLAQDALHIAAMLDAEVLGFEAEPMLACLAQAGLRRIVEHRPRWAEAAAKIEAQCASSLQVLRRMGDGSVPVVMLDPMFETPLRATPGYDLLRQCAYSEPLTDALLEEAVRVAGARVLVKVPLGRAEQPLLGLRGYNRRVCGRACDYLIIEKELTDPVWEIPRAGRSYPYRAPR